MIDAFATNPGDIAPNFDLVAQFGGWALLVFAVIAAVIAFFVVRWDRRERAKARAKWEREHPGQSWDALDKRRSS